MGALLSTTRNILNLLLPFTSPQTPLLQDLVHTAVLVGTFYYGPQIAEYYNTHYASTNAAAGQQPLQNHTTDPPLDENLVLQPDTDAEDLDPPPLAPTPPPGLGGLPADAAAGEAPQWQQNPNDLDNDNDPFAPGPALDPNRPRPTPANRTIGTKKAKSLARRDQRRAYHEFHRSQAEQRKREEAEGKEERDALLLAEKARRANVERDIMEARRVEVEARKEEERRRAEEEFERRERVVERVREEIERVGAVDLVDGAWVEGKDRVWIERLVRASGMMAQMEKVGRRVLITADGWMVRLDDEIMREAYEAAGVEAEEGDGTVGFDEFGDILERVVRARVAAAA